MFRRSALRSPFLSAGRSVAALTASFLGALLLAAVPNASAQNVPVGFSSTVAGGGTVCAGSYSTYAPLAANQKLVGDGCPSAQSTLNTPVGLAIDRYNNVVIMDQTNNLVRVIYNGGAAMAAAIVAANPQITGLVPQKGDIYTLVGGPQSTPTETTYYCTETGGGIVGFDKQLDGCPGAYAFIMPRGVAFDRDGNLYISSLASAYDVRVLYIGGTQIANLIALENPGLTGSPQVGYVYEIAGTGAPTNVTGGDGGLAYKASISQPRGLYIDPNENVYFTDTLNGLIRRVDGTTGLISTVVGYCASTSCPASASAGDGNPANSSAVRLNYAYGLVVDTNGNMFIADSGSGTGATGRIRVVYAGGTLPGISNPVVGDIYTYAGGGATTGTAAQQTTFQYVEGVGMDANGAIYIDDYRNATSPGSNHVWRVDPTTGAISVVAGNGGTAGPTAGGYCSNSSGTLALDTRGDGCPGPQTYMNSPQQTPVFDTLGNFYIAEHNGNVVRYFSYNNTFPSTPVGSSTTQSLAFVVPFATAADSPLFKIDGVTSTEFSDAGNDVCVGAQATPSVSVCTLSVKFTPAVGNTRSGAITETVSASSLTTEPLIGVGSVAQLTIDPGTTTALGTGIRPQGVSVDLNGNVYLSDGTGKQVLKTTLAGATPTAVFTGLGSPQGTATDSFGNVYVADATNNNVLQRTPGTSATTSTVVSGLSGPTGMAADIYGDVYIADTGNNRILRYSAVTSHTTLVNVYPQTLSGPTSLFVDGAGDLYILDSGNKRIVELPVAALPVITTLPAGVVPAAFALDHAGNLYLADTSSSTLLVATTSGTKETLRSNLTTPVGLAIDTAGDLFLADSSATSVVGINRTLSTDSFATTNLHQQSLPTALSLNSIGDLAASLGSPLFTESGNSADFPAASTGNTCNAGAALAAGTYCTESFVFAPMTTTGARAAVITFTPTAGTTVTADLGGTAVNLINTTLTIMQTAPTTATVSYGQTTTFTATVTASSTGATAPTGTVIFVVDGISQPAQTYAAAGNSLTDNLAVGTHVIAASYSGDSVYAGSNTSTSLTVLKSPTASVVSSSQNVSGVSLSSTVTPMYTGALGLTGTVTFYIDGVAQTAQPVGNGTVSQVVSVADGTHAVYAVYSGDGDYATSTSPTSTLTVARAATTTALSITPVTNTTSVSLQLKAVVAGTGGTPSGTVTFYNGSTLLSTVTLSGGTAGLTFPLTIPLPATYAFTATYSGDGFFQPSTITLTESGDFAILMSNATLVVPQAGQATAAIAVVSVANYTGTLTATCTNLPANSLCRFSPTPLTVAPGANGNLTVQVFVGVPPTVGDLSGGWSRNIVLRCTVLLLSGLSLAGLLLRRRRFAPSLLSVLLLTVAGWGILGCGRNNAATFQNGTYVTPTGTYPASVNITDTNNVTHSVTLTVQVNSQ